MTTQLNVVYLDKFDLFAQLGQKFNALISSLADAAQKRKAYNELVKLDDRMLADIGLKRGMIKNAVAGR